MATYLTMIGSKFDRSGKDGRRFSRLRVEQVFAAWRHVAAVAYLRSPARLAMVVGLAFINAVLQLAAVAIVIGAVQAISNDGQVDLLDISVRVELDRPTLYLGIALVVVCLLMASISQYLVGLLTANFRREYFAELIVELLKALQKMTSEGGGVIFNSKIFARIMRRECRYLARAYVAALSVIPPVIVFVAIAAFAAFNFPQLLLPLVFLLAFTTPFHIALTSWGASVSSDLVRTAQNKSSADERIAARVLSHPYRAVSDGAEFEQHVRSPEVAGFLDTYRDRMRLGALSSLISSLTSVLALGALVAYFAEQYMSGSLNLSGIVFVVLAIRLLLSNAAQMAQSFTVIGSFQPFFQVLLTFLDPDGELPTQRSMSRPHTGQFAVIFDPNPISLLSARQLHRDFRPQHPDVAVRLVISDFEPLGEKPTAALGFPPTYGPKHMERWLPEISPANLQALRVFLAQPAVTEASWAELPAAVKIISSMRAALGSRNATIVIHAGNWQLLSHQERAALLEKLTRQLVIYVFATPPKRYSLGGDIPMYATQGNQLQFVCDGRELDVNRETIAGLLARERGRNNAKYFQMDDDESAEAV